MEIEVVVAEVYVVVLERSDLGRDFGSRIFLCSNVEYPYFGMYLDAEVELCRVSRSRLPCGPVCSASTRHSFLATFLGAVIRLSVA